MEIGGIKIGLNKSPAVIAEMSGNHNQSLDRALSIVDAAVASGVNLIKLQTYTADTITLDSNKDGFVIKNSESLWVGRSLYSLYKEAHTPWEWQRQIIEHATNLGAVCFSSVFDESSVDFLETLNISAYKLASQEIIHLPLIREVARTGKPIIMSTGMATIAEIDEAFNEALKFGAKDIALLKCTSSYPASPRDSNVLTIPYLRQLFGCEVGLSDHSLGIGVAVAAVAHGATLIEKHLTLSRSHGGVDSAFSMEPNEFKNLIEEVNRAQESLGKIYFGPTEAEIGSLSGRRSIYVTENIRAGDKLTKANIRIIRPSFGLLPKYYPMIIGRVVSRDVERGTPFSWDLLG